MINLCPNIWLIENLKCQQFLFWKKNHQKNKKFFRGHYSVIGGPIDKNADMFWETSLAKMYGFATFPEI